MTSDDTRLCLDCRSLIQKDAKKCKICGSYQGRLQRYLSISNTTLALLVALIAVTTPLAALVFTREEHSGIRTMLLPDGIYFENNGDFHLSVTRYTLSYCTFLFSDETEGPGDESTVSSGDCSDQRDIDIHLPSPSEYFFRSGDNRIVLLRDISATPFSDQNGQYAQIPYLDADAQIREYYANRNAYYCWEYYEFTDAREMNYYFDQAVNCETFFTFLWRLWANHHLDYMP